MEWPTKASHYFSSNFGENRDDHFHMGLDIKTKGTIGHEVVAVEDGYISRMFPITTVMEKRFIK